MTTNIGSMAMQLSLNAQQFNQSVGMSDTGLKNFAANAEVQGRRIEKALGGAALAARQLAAAVGGPGSAGIMTAAAMAQLAQQRARTSHAQPTGASRPSVLPIGLSLDPAQKFWADTMSRNAATDQAARKLHAVGQASATARRQVDSLTKSLMAQHGAFKQLGTMDMSKMSLLSRMMGIPGEIGRGAMAMVPGGAGMLRFGALYGGYSMIKEAATYEREMARVQAVSGASGEQFEGLQGLARHTGRTSIFSAGEAAQGMREFAMAGFDVQQIMHVITPTLEAANAAGLDLEQTAQIVVNVLNQFKLSAADAPKVIDSLVYAANNSAMKFEDLGTAMHYAGAIAKAMGKDLYEVEAALMGLADSGLRAELGGTALRAMMMKMSERSDQARRLMNDLGISFSDAAGDMKSIPDIIDHINEKLAKFTGYEKAEALGTILEMRASTGLASILNSSDKIRKHWKEIRENSSGTAKKFSERFMETAAAQTQVMVNNFKDLGINVLEGIKGTLSDITGIIADIVKLAGTFKTEILAAVLAFKAVGGSMGAAVTLSGFIGWNYGKGLWEDAHGGRKAGELSAGGKEIADKLFKEQEERNKFWEHKVRLGGGFGSGRGNRSIEDQIRALESGGAGQWKGPGSFWEERAKQLSLTHQMDRDPATGRMLNNPYTEALLRHKRGFEDRTALEARKLTISMRRTADVPGGGFGFGGMGVAGGKKDGGMAGAERIALELDTATKALTRKYEDQAFAVGKSATQLEIYELSLKAVTRAEKDAIAALEEKAAIADAAKVWEETRTPMEKYAQRIEYLQQLQRTGKMDPDTYARAALAAENMLGDRESAFKPGEAAIQGGREALRAIDAFRSRQAGMVANKERRMEQLQAEGVRLQKEGVDLLRKVNEKLEGKPL